MTEELQVTKSKGLLRVCAVLALAFSLTAPAGEAQSYKLIHSFSGDGGAPNCALLQTPDGRLYGTAAFGGIFTRGSVFVLSPNETGGFEFVTLYSFRGGDGANPRSALVQGPDGSFYGTTERGGPNDGGTVFRVDGAGNFAMLHSFPYTYGPSAGLVLGKDGDLYGVGDGGIFRISVSGVETSLHSWGSFPGDGSGSQAPLIQAADGDFYGTTSGGGANGVGVVFRMTSIGQVSILHSFSEAEGFLSTAALIQAPDGSFYGATQVGGLGRWGSVFRLDSSGSFGLAFFQRD